MGAYRSRYARHFARRECRWLPLLRHVPHKGAEYETVIAYGLLEGMVPHYSDPAKIETAKEARIRRAIAGL